MIQFEVRDLLHADLIKNQLVRSCLNCESFDKQTGVCTHFNMQPPPDVLVFSCKDAWFGEVPF